MNRRYFLASSAPAGTRLATKGLASANDTVRVACVGVRGYKTFLGPDQEPGTDLNGGIEGRLSTQLARWLGRSLHFDSQSLECVNDKEASAMFTRQYKAPFAVHQKSLMRRSTAASRSYGAAVPEAVKTHSS